MDNYLGIENHRKIFLGENPFEHSSFLGDDEDGVGVRSLGFSNLGFSRLGFSNLGFSNLGFSNLGFSNL